MAAVPRCPKFLSATLHPRRKVPKFRRSNELNTYEFNACQLNEYELNECELNECEMNECELNECEMNEFELIEYELNECELNATSPRRNMIGLDLNQTNDFIWLDSYRVSHITSHRVSHMPSSFVKDWWILKFSSTFMIDRLN